MGQLEQQFANHQLWALLHQFGEKLDSTPEVADEEALEQLARLRWMHEQLMALRQRNPWTVPVATLNSLQSALGTIDQQLAQWAGNPAAWASYLPSAATQYTDQVVTHLMALGPKPDANVRAAETAAQDAINRSASSMNTLRQRAAQLEAQIVEQQQAGAAAVAAQEQASSAAVATLREEQSAMEGQLRTLASTISEQSTQLTTALSAQQIDFTAALTAMRKDAAELGEEVVASAGAERVQQSEAAEGHLVKLADLQKQAEQVVQNTGRRAITTEYGQYAQGERASALVWSVLTVLFAVAGFVFVLFELSRDPASGMSWQTTLLKATGTLALLGGAAYAGKQAADHRTQERDAKRTQLDINAVEPFLARLPEAKQDELRAAIADRVFARRSASDQADVATPVSLEGAGLIGRAIKAFTEKA